jgi:SAM-dependent methyltransferase
MAAMGSTDIVHQMVVETAAAYDAFALYWDIMYAAQGRTTGGYRPGVCSAYASVVRDLGAKNVLDCACGTGDPIVGLAVHPALRDMDLRFAGSDGSTAMLGRCAWNAIAAGLHVSPLGSRVPKGGLELFQCKWDDLPTLCCGRLFDLVLCCGHALYHLITRDAMVTALRAMAALTSEGGHVMFDTLRWAGDLRGEEGRGEIRYRGWTTLGERRMDFLDTTRYEAIESAVCQVVQLKEVCVREEMHAQLREISSFRFWGAPFDPDTAFELASAAGFVDVHLVEFDEAVVPGFSRRYATVLGRRP